MIKAKIKSVSGNELKTPVDIFIWLNAREIGNDKLAITPMIHKDEESAKKIKESKTDRGLVMMCALPPNAITIDCPSAFTGDFRNEYHKAFVEILKTNKDLTNIEIVL